MASKELQEKVNVRFRGLMRLGEKPFVRIDTKEEIEVLREKAKGMGVRYVVIVNEGDNEQGFIWW